MADSSKRKSWTYTLKDSSANKIVITYDFLEKDDNPDDDIPPQKYISMVYIGTRIQQAYSLYKNAFMGELDDVTLRHNRGQVVTYEQGLLVVRGDEDGFWKIVLRAK